MTTLSGLDRGARLSAAPFRRAPAILGRWLALPLRRTTLRIRNPLWPVTVPVVWGALATVGFVVAVMVFVDAPAIEAARRLPKWLVDSFDFITDFGKSGWFLIPFGSALVVLALAASMARSRTTYLALTSVGLRVWFLFLAASLPGLLTDVLKLVGRARPFVTGVADPFAYSFLDGRSDYASLPSGHATTVFAMATAFGALWPRTRPFMWTFAAVIALSRVVVTAHHPSDVIVGAIVGVLGTMLICRWFAARRLVFLVGPGAEVRGRPGPSLRRIRILTRGLFGRSNRGPSAAR